MQTFKFRMYAISLLLYFCLVTRASVIFEDCGSAYDLVTVNIDGCGRNPPCYVTLGERIPVNVRFYADFASLQLDQDVVIKLNFIDAKTPVTPEPCDILLCPVQTDALTSFTSIMSVPPNMALVSISFFQGKAYVITAAHRHPQHLLASALSIFKENNQRGFLQWRVYNEKNRVVLCYSVLVQTQTYIQKMLRQSALLSSTDKMKRKRLFPLGHPKNPVGNLPNVTFEFYD